MNMRDTQDEEVQKEYSKQWIPVYGLMRSAYKSIRNKPSIILDSYVSKKSGLFCKFSIYHGLIIAMIYETTRIGLELLVDSFK